MSSLKEKYSNKVKKELEKELELKNMYQVPTIKKIVINSGLGVALTDPKIIDLMVEDMAAFTGQKPVIAKSKYDISNFNRLRKGHPIGVFVTLRGDKMWDFLDRLVNVVLPGLRDFRGISNKSFDKQGNYNLGIKEHSAFFEVDQNRLDKARGIQITISTSTNNVDHSYLMLKKLGMPFSN